jgi:hypothetical protein
MGSPSAKDKQAMLDEMDANLAELKVTLEERKALTTTWVRLIGFDLYMTYVYTLQRYWEFKQQDMQRELSKDPNNQTLKDEVERWRTGVRAWKPNYSVFSQLGTYSFEDEMDRISPKGWLSEKDQRAVDTFKSQIVTHYRATQAKGGWTKDAAEFYDTYHDLAGQDKKIVELFGFNPSAPR